MAAILFFSSSSSSLIHPRFPHMPHLPFFAYISPITAVGDHEWSAQEALMRTNYFGAVAAIRSFLPLLDAQLGRVVNVVSDAAAEYVASASDAAKAILTNAHVTSAEIESLIESESAAWGSDAQTAYALSRAALMSYTMVIAREYPNLTTISCSKPIDGMPADTPAATFKCLRDGILDDSIPGHGWHYSWDGVRAPLDSARDESSPPFQGPPFEDEYPLKSTCRRRRRLDRLIVPFSNVLWGYPTSSPDGCERVRHRGPIDPASIMPSFREERAAVGGGHHVVAGAGIGAALAAVISAAAALRRRS